MWSLTVVHAKSIINSCYIHDVFTEISNLKERI